MDDVDPGVAHSSLQRQPNTGSFNSSEILMQYILLIYGQEKDWAAMPEAEMKKMYAAYGTFTQDEVEKTGPIFLVCRSAL